MKTIILIIVPTVGSKADMLEAALKLTDSIRKQGHVPIARCLDKEYEHTPNSIEEMRTLERTMIRTQFVNGVRFSDLDQVGDEAYLKLYVDAKQYGYIKEGATA